MRGDVNEHDHLARIGIPGKTTGAPSHFRAPHSLFNPERKATYMKIRHKFNLARIGHQYESIDIEVEGTDVEGLIKEIDEAWRMYCKAIVEERVQ